MIVVSANDCAGEFARRQCSSLDEACAAVRELVTKYPRKVICCANARECDYGFNGLTEDEDEALFAAECGARRQLLRADIHKVVRQ